MHMTATKDGGGKITHGDKQWRYVTPIVDRSLGGGEDSRGLVGHILTGIVD